MLNSSSPSLKFNLFINNRLVHCTPIKRVVECAYSVVISRTLSSSANSGDDRINKNYNSKSIRVSNNSNIFKSATCNSLYVYLNIQLPPHTLDVNVHPTKAEVNFLHEDEIVNGLQDAIEHALLSSAQIRTFIKNSLPTPVTFSKPEEVNPDDESGVNTSKYLQSPQVVYRPHEKVRIDVREQQLERFLSPQLNRTTKIISGNSNCKREIEASDESLLKKSKVEMSPDIEVDSDEADELLKSNSREEQSLFGHRKFDINILRSNIQSGLYDQSENDTDSSLPSSSTQNTTENQVNLNTTNDIDYVVNDNDASLTAKPIIKSDRISSSSQDTTSIDFRSLLIKSNPASSSLKNDPNDSFLSSPSLSKTRHRKVYLMSILALKRNLEGDLDKSIKAVLRSCKFIGFIDETRCLAQHNTELLLIRLKPLTQALFYQLLLVNFANHGEIILREPALLSDLLSIGHEYLRKSSRSLANLSRSEFIQEASTTLMKHAPMLWDYFSIKITTDSNGNNVLTGLPLIIANYIPDLDNLPIYITKLATQVSWSIESVCFENICRITAEYYSVSRSLFAKALSSKDNSSTTTPHEGDKENSTIQSSREWMIKHILWPVLTSSFLPSRRYPNFDSDMQETERKVFPLQSAFIRLTSLTELYKVFERC
uniref:DNA mismatch repair protein S5 domain-containing protein n=1 Tax=Trichobilharzia regenti TaxID=157069 RepID=A0AA85K0M0_TRIRE|nr:unnamed protein product [Trichobilharzia regenti]